VLCFLLDPEPSPANTRHYAKADQNNCKGQKKPTYAFHDASSLKS
jgi:hypothetical protein